MKIHTSYTIAPYCGTLRFPIERLIRDYLPGSDPETVFAKVDKQGGAYVVTKQFKEPADYETYRRPSTPGFVVMKKRIREITDLH